MAIIFILLWLLFSFRIFSTEAVGDEDNYGLEMDAYLNEEDILKPGESNRPGILRYCTPNAATSTSRTAGTRSGQALKRKLSDKEDAVNAQLSPRNKKRKSNQLPNFGSDEHLNESSDDELPDIDIGNRTRKCPTEVNQIDVDDTFSTEEDNGKVETSEKDTSETENDKTGESNGMLKDLDKWKTKNKKKVKTTRHKLGKRDMRLENKTQRDDFYEGTSHEEIVLEVLPDDDHCDFEEPVDTGRRSCTTTLSEEIMKDTGKKVETESVASSSSDIELDMSRNNFDNYFVKPEHFKVFPIFTPESALSQYVPQKNESIILSVPEKVPTPPSPGELRDTLKYMELTDRLSPIEDLLDLVDKWEKEKKSHPCSPQKHVPSVANINEACKSRVSISATSIRINTTKNNCRFVTTTRQKKKGIDRAVGDTDNWSSGEMEIPNAELLVEIPSDLELDVMSDLRNLSFRSSSKSATSATLHTSTTLSESDDVQSLGSVCLNLKPKKEPLTLKDKISNVQIVDTDDAPMASCEETDLDDTKSVQSVYSRYGIKHDTTVSIDSTDSETDKMKNAQSVHSKPGDTVLSIGKAFGSSELTEALDVGTHKNDDNAIGKGKAIHSKQGDQNEIRTIFKQFGSPQLAKACESYTQKNDDRNVSLQPNPIIEVDADEMGSALSVSSKSPREGQSSRLTDKTPQHVDAVQSKSSKSSHSVHSDDSVSILTPAHNVSTLDTLVPGHLETSHPSCNSTPIPWSKPKTTVKTAHKSFYDDELDDSVFAAVQTPFSSRATQNIIRTPGQSSPRPGDTSQITFTQALNCVHDSSNSEGSQGFDLQNSPRPNEKSEETISDESTSPIFRVPERTPSAGKRDETDLLPSKQESFNQTYSKCICAEDTTTNISAENTTFSEGSYADEPKFDLGFDLSDDDDVIPPSPRATGTQPFSQISARSFSSTSLTKMRSFGPAMEQIEDQSKLSDIEWGDDSQSLLESVKPSNETGNVNSSHQTLKQNSSCSDIENHLAQHRTNTSKFGSQHKDSPSAQLSRGINHRISSQISSQIKHHSDPPVAVVVPTLSQPQEKFNSHVEKIDDTKDRNLDINSESEKLSMYDIPDLDDDFDEEIFKTQEAPAGKSHEAGDTATEQVSYRMDQANIETIDQTAFEDYNLESIDLNDEHKVEDLISDGESDTSDAGNSSPVLTLSNKNSKYHM